MPSKKPTRHWFHIVATTYGAWLPGDERGFRTRRHRIHVEGDYKHRPPAEAHAVRRAVSNDSLTDDVVRLNAAQRRIVGRALVMSFASREATVIAASVSTQHVHVLIGFGNRKARHWTGLAKRDATMALRGVGFPGKVWAVRSRAEPVRSRSHQLRAMRYILKHAEHGAWVWRFGDALD